MDYIFPSDQCVFKEWRRRGGGEGLGGRGWRRVRRVTAGDNGWQRVVTGVDERQLETTGDGRVQRLMTDDNGWQQVGSLSPLPSSRPKDGSYS